MSMMWAFSGFLLDDLIRWRSKDLKIRIARVRDKIAYKQKVRRSHPRTKLSLQIH